MIFTLEAACGSFIGNGRNKNEDNFYFNKKHLPENNKGLKNPLKCKGNTLDTVLFAVFDGMGGGVNGEKASLCASQVFAEEYKKLDEIAISCKAFLITACENANGCINNISHMKQIGTMGTTVAALCLSQNEAVACNVGDSKVFRIRNNQMLQISEDHTDEKIMKAIGIKKKPVLLQYLGVPDTEMAIEPFVTKGDIVDEDIFVLCSDGVTDNVPLEALYRLIKERTVDDAVRAILAEVNKNDGADNATIIVVKLKKQGGDNGGY